MAASHQAPVSFHCYKAWPQLIGLIRETKGGLSRFVLHSFHGPLDVIEEVTELGGYFSLSPSFFRLSAEQRASYYSRIPPHRLLLETDAPNQFLPASYGDTNGRDPRLIRSLFQLVGEDLDEDQVTLKRRIAENFHQAFEKGAAHAP
jgi:TatD DNase family protein